MSCLRLCAVGGHGRKGSYQSKARKADRWGCTCVPCFFMCLGRNEDFNNEPLIIRCYGHILPIGKNHVPPTLGRCGVTADHETGGIALGTGKYALNLKALENQKASAEVLSKKISDLRKAKNNHVAWEDIKNLLSEEMGFWSVLPITWEQEKKLRDEYEKSFVRNKVEFAESMYAKTEPMAAKAKEVMDQIAMVGWTSGGHSAGYVPVFAIGAGSDLFIGKMDNTEIPKRIAKAGGYK